MTITQDDLTWMFKDPEWKNKFLVGTLLTLAYTLIPLLGLVALAIVYGYALILMRAVMRGDSRALPKWDDFGALFVDGGKAILSAIGYYLPGVIIFACGFLFFALSQFFLQPARNPGIRDISPLILFFARQAGLFLIIGIVMFVSFIGHVLSPVAVGQYVRTGNISAGYRLAEVWQVLRSNLWGFVLANLVYRAFVYGLGMVNLILIYTIILCVFTPFLYAPIMFYLAILYAQLFGAVYREGALNAELMTA